MTGFLLRRFRGYGDTDAEIDENLIRADLTAMERGEHLQRRKELHEARYPDTREGQAQARGMNQTLGHNVAADSAATFTEDVAAKTGKSARTIREDVQIAKGIAQDVRDAIRDTLLAPELAPGGHAAALLCPT